MRGMSTSSGLLSCQAFAYNTAGNLASSSATVSFPKNGTYTSVSLSLSSVPAGSMGNVGCTMSGNNTSVLLGIDYAPWALADARNR